MVPLLQVVSQPQRCEIIEGLLEEIEKIGVKPVTMKKIVMLFAESLASPQEEIRGFYDFSKKDLILENMNRKNDRIQSDSDSVHLHESL